MFKILADLVSNIKHFRLIARFSELLWYTLNDYRVVQGLIVKTSQEILAVEAVVEIPKGSRNKYEIDHETGIVRLDRVLFSSVHYPTDYGFVLNTMAADSDPLDVLIIVEEPTFPGCHVMIRPIGVLVMRDEKGLDEKILAVPIADPRFNTIKDISQLQPHWLTEIENFFSTYKLLEGKETTVAAWKGAKQAARILNKYKT